MGRTEAITFFSPLPQTVNVGCTENLQTFLHLCNPSSFGEGGGGRSHIYTEHIVWAAKNRRKHFYSVSSTHQFQVEMKEGIALFCLLFLSPKWTKQFAWNSNYLFLFAKAQIFNLGWLEEQSLAVLFSFSTS